MAATSRVPIRTYDRKAGRAALPLVWPFCFWYNIPVSLNPCRRSPCIWLRVGATRAWAGRLSGAGADGTLWRSAEGRFPGPDRPPFHPLRRAKWGFRSSSNGVNPLKALDEKRKMTPCAARVSAPFGYFGWRHPKYPRLDGAFGCAMIPCGPRTPCVLTRLTPQNWAKTGKEHKTH